MHYVSRSCRLFQRAGRARYGAAQERRCCNVAARIADTCRLLDHQHEPYSLLLLPLLQLSASKANLTASTFLFFLSTTSTKYYAAERHLQDGVQSGSMAQRSHDAVYIPSAQHPHFFAARLYDAGRAITSPPHSHGMARRSLNR